MRRSLLPVLLFMLFVRPAFAQTARLVADLRTNPDHGVSSEPLFLGKTSSLVFFVPGAETLVALWRSDGTAEGTFALPVTFERGRINGFVAGDRIAYIGLTEAVGSRIWRTDGSAAGTVPITSFSQYKETPLLVAGDKLFYLADGGRELRAYNGSSGYRLAGVLPASLPDPYSALAHGRLVYIALPDGLWKSDGTLGGTAKLTDAQAFHLTAVENNVFFAGKTHASGAELWTTDGTPAGTRMVTELTPGVGSTLGRETSALAAAGNQLVFVGSNGELGLSDGTAAGTRVMRQGVPPRPAFPPSVPQIAVLNDVAYFAFEDDSGSHLWRSDGTEAGTSAIAGTGGAERSPVVAGASRVYFVAAAPGQPQNLYVTDGTAEGTRLRFERLSMPHRPRTFITLGDRAFFDHNDGFFGNEPWTSSAAGTTMLANVQPEQRAGSSEPKQFIVGNDRLYFTAMLNSSGARPVWMSDGTASGTTVFVPDAMQPLAATGGLLYLKRDREELWRAGPEPGSKAFLKDLEEDISSTVIGGRLYMTGRTKHSDRQLWTTDGTPESTRMLTEPDSRNSTELPVALADQNYVRTATGAVYAVGARPEETRVVVAAGGVGARLVAFKGALYTIVADGPSVELRRFSGAPGVATPLKRFEWASFQSGEAVAGGNLLFFARHDGSSGLWKTDGTTSGTTLVRAIPFTDRSPWKSGPQDFVSLGDRAIFGVYSADHDFEPWVSDGTPEGTLRLTGAKGYSRTDIHTDAGPAFAVVDGIAYFAATDAAHGRELWRTDGTPAGTTLAADIVPGATGSELTNLTPFRDALYFSARTPETGEELWAYPLPAAPAAAVADVRVAESSSHAIVPVRLTRSSPRPVTVRYSTADDTAVAGRDYTAANGTLTFEPGETEKSISVAIADSSAAGPRRVFTIRAESSDVRVARTVGAVIVDDDDAAADVELSFAGDARVIAKNNGPTAASSVRLCVGVALHQLTLTCSTSAVLEVGASFFQRLPLHTTGTVAASVTQVERDPVPANNAMEWHVDGFTANLLWVGPAAPRVGTTGVVGVERRQSSTPTTVTLVSSDPAVVTVPATVVVPAGEERGTTTFNAHKAGLATITATTRGNQQSVQSVTVRVVGPTEAVRGMPIVRMDTPMNWQFGNSRQRVAVDVTGIRPSGATPTGLVTLYEDDEPVAQGTLAGGKLTFAFDAPTPGRHTYSTIYSGDSEFFAARVEKTQWVQRGAATVGLGGVEGGKVTVTLRGVRGHVPSGTIRVFENGIERPVSGPLFAISETSSSATVSSVSPDARTLTVNYSGDSRYYEVGVTIPVSRSGRTRSVRH